MRVLLVEDDIALREGLADVLQRGGYALSSCDDGRQALDLLLREQFDLAIVDLGLPGMDGLDVLRVLRHRRRHVPIMIITARGGLNERIAGLDGGADDYLIKPFEVAEFEARVRALLRRHSAGSGAELEIGSLRFAPGQPVVTTGSEQIVLQPGELAILELLATQADHVVSRDLVMARMQREGLSTSNNAVDMTVHKLRRKLEAHGIVIRALRGYGYALETKVGQADGPDG